MSALLVFITAPADAAPSLARLLVEQRLAACVNCLSGVRSVYRWQGAVQEDDEVLLLAKTSAEGFEALRAAVVAAHPYELPEIVAVKLADAHAPYLHWLLGNLARSAPDPKP